MKSKKGSLDLGEQKLLRFWACLETEDIKTLKAIRRNKPLLFNEVSK